MRPFIRYTRPLNKSHEKIHKFKKYIYNMFNDMTLDGINKTVTQPNEIDLHDLKQIQIEKKKMKKAEQFYL